MSASAWVGLNTALRGLLAHQRALDLAGHNIANVDTPGYTRQEAVLATSPSIADYGIGMIGTGVDVVTYRRVRADWLDVQLRAETMKRGQADATQEGLSQVELALNEPSDSGLGSLLSKFWSSWHDVAAAPESIGARQALVQSAAALADGFRGLSSQLDAIVAATGPMVADALSEVNAVGAQIGSLNKSIIDLKVAGLEPNDLLDRRDALVDRLSELVNTSVTLDPSGGIDVSVAGTTLVSADGTVAAALAESDLTALTSGRLKGLVDLRDVTLPGYRAQLNTLASALVTQTNALHSAGFDLNGNAGGAFFTGTDAATIDVSAAIAATPALLAASAGGAPGDSGQALKIAGLRLTPIVGAATLDDAYSQLVTRIGADSQQAQTAFSLAKSRTDVLDEHRLSVSGVSLDEEMTSLIRFQRGYQASARVMSAVDEMLDVLVSRTGRVGL